MHDRHTPNSPVSIVKLVGSLGNDPSELQSVGFTVRTVSLTVYLPIKLFEWWDLHPQRNRDSAMLHGDILISLCLFVSTLKIGCGWEIRTPVRCLWDTYLNHSINPRLKVLHQFLLWLPACYIHQPQFHKRAIECPLAVGFVVFKSLPE